MHFSLPPKQLSENLMLSSLPPFYLMIKQVDHPIANTFLGQHFCPLPIFDGCEPSLLYHNIYYP